ncbi:Segmentation protein cap'n'collar [Trichoplax sp. H2]|nr:Segmentation protein cap'n'collar [Trichoplax sp. H2]|eukprot:RDD37429.1 Segmentation protein cap'n'collar [Trichoplax sp. H2]
MLSATDLQQFIVGILTDVATLYVCASRQELMPYLKLDDNVIHKMKSPMWDEAVKTMSKYPQSTLQFPSGYHNSFSHNIHWPTQAVVAFFDVVPDEQNINEQADNGNSNEMPNELANDDEMDDIFSNVEEEITTDYNTNLLTPGELSSAVLSMKSNTTGEFDWDYWHFGNDDTPNMLPLNGWKGDDNKGITSLTGNAVNGLNDEDSFALANIVDDDDNNNLGVSEDWWGQLPTDFVDSPSEGCSNGYRSDGNNTDQSISPSVIAADSDSNSRSEAWDQIKKHINDDEVLLHSINSLASHQSSQGFLPFIPPNIADISPISRNGFSWDHSGQDDASGFNTNQNDLFHELGLELDVLGSQSNNEASLHLNRDGPLSISTTNDNHFLHHGIPNSSFNNATGNPYGEFFDLMGLDNQSPTGELKGDLPFQPIQASRNGVASTASQPHVPPYSSSSSSSRDAVYALFTDSRPYECNPQTMGATMDMGTFFGYNNDAIRLENSMVDSHQVASQSQPIGEWASANGTVVYGETQSEFAEIFGVPTNSMLVLPVPERELVDMPVNEFLAMIERLPSDVAALARDVRRRGKNKFAARNCRKRKIDDIDGLKDEVDDLEVQKDSLLAEVKKLEEESEKYRKKSEAMYKKIEKYVKMKEANNRS